MTLDAAPGAAVEETLPVARQLLRALLADDLAQPVRLPPCEPGQGHGHLDHIFLVNQHAVGFRKQLPQARVDGLIRSPVQPQHILPDIPVGSRADDGGVDHQVLEIPPLRFLLQLPHGRGFDVKDAHGVAPPDEGRGLRIVQGIEPGVVDGHPRAPPNGCDGIADDGERPVAQEIDLHQARRFRLVLFPLDDPDSLGAPLDGHMARHLVRDQDDTAAVDREMPGDGIQSGSQLQDFRPGRIQVKPVELRMVVHTLPEPRGVCPGAHAPGHFLDFRCRNPENLGHLPHRPAPRKPHVVRHKGQTLRPIVPNQLVREIVPLIPGKIDVDVGRVLSLRVQEASEEQPVADGVHMGDAEQITHQAGSTAPAATMDGAAPDDVRHHQEVVHVALGANQVQLFRKARFDDRAGPSVAPDNAPAALLEEQREVVRGLIPVVGKDQPEVVPCRVTPASQLDGVGEGFGSMREMHGHLTRRFEPPVGLDDLLRREGAEGPVEVDGPNETVEIVIVRVHEMDGVGGHGRNSQLAGHLQGFPARRSRQHLDPAVEPTAQPLDEPGIGAQHGHIARSFFRQAPEHRKVTLQMPAAHHLADQLIAPGRFRQENGLLPVCLQMSPRDGSDSVLPGRLQKIDQPVKPVGVRERQALEPRLRRSPAKSLHGAHPPHHGVMRMHMQVDEGRMGRVSGSGFLVSGLAAFGLPRAFLRK